MDLAKLIFGVLVAICCVVVATMCVEEPTSADGVPVGHGIAHPEFETMLQGGDGTGRIQPIRYLAWAYGILLLALFVSLLLFGIRKQESVGRVAAPYVIGLVAYAGGLVWLYQEYSRFSSGDYELIGSVPTPTAALLYVVWPVPVIFILAFVYQYDRWTYTDADAKEFAGIVEQYKARQKD